ncbi:MAG: hypothetical protein ACP5JG_09495 [Anaerolineae bacterium]
MTRLSSQSQRRGPGTRHTVWRWIGVLCGLLWLSMGVSCAATSPAESWDEDFESADAWRLGSDAVADVAVTGGQLQIHVLQPGQVAWASTEQTWADLHVAVDAMQVSGPVDNEYGVLIRMDADDHFYAFSISGDGYARVARFQDGAWSVLGPDWTPVAAIREGMATNHLEVIAAGNTFEFRVNEQVVAQVGDEALQKGRLGLYAGAFGEADVVVAFDNLHVEPVP